MKQQKAKEQNAAQVELSPGEWKLMNRLWDNAPRTITQLVSDLAGDTGWSKHTVITMLNRLEAKGAVRYEEAGRAKAYFPAVEREGVALNETESLLERVYGGSLGLLVNAFVQQKGITEQEREELLRILERADPKKGG